VPITRYRIFVQEKDTSGTRLDFTTPDARLSYMLKTPKSMWGKDYLVTVQAINKNHKMSLVSEPSVFRIDSVQAEAPAPKSKVSKVVAPPKPVQPAPAATNTTKGGK